jgi:hypothetical protein
MNKAEKLRRHATRRRPRSGSCCQQAERAESYQQALAGSGVRAGHYRRHFCQADQGHASRSGAPLGDNERAYRGKRRLARPRPWFVYFSVAYQGRTWQCPKHSGKPSTNNCGFSTKAAVGWAALFGDSYSKLLEDKARSLVSPDGYTGDAYPGGKRNTSLNINTNALILEAMLFRQRGPSCIPGDQK